LNISLKPIWDKLEYATRSFNEISFTHVYREKNVEVYMFSKEGQHVLEGKVIIEENRDDIISIF
jgi:hypothetical protein